MVKKKRSRPLIWTPTSPDMLVNSSRHMWATTWWRKLRLCNAGQGSEPAAVSDESFSKRDRKNITITMKEPIHW